MNNQLIEELYKTIEAKDNIINNQALEIASLNEDITWWTNRFKAVERDNKQLKEEIENYKQENTELKGKLKEITKRIRKAIDDDEDDLLYALFDIQDIIQDEEEQKRLFDKYIKPYIGDKETEEAFNNFNGDKKGYEFE